MGQIVLVVEGDGDVQAVPVLVRRVLQERLNIFDVSIVKPVQKRGDIKKIKANFKRFLNIALLEMCPILWVVDCDDGDWVVQEKDLQKMLDGEYHEVPVQFSLMVKEFESLFLAEQSAASHILDLQKDTKFPPQPEIIRGAKEWLSKHMADGFSYKETVHQEKITGRIDLSVLHKTSPSYQRFEAAVTRLVQKA